MVTSRTLWAADLDVPLGNRPEDLDAVPADDRAQALIVRVARRDRGGEFVLTLEHVEGLRSVATR